ncbi:MAG TPA: ATP-binding protein [Geobacteraceae bacterium]|nr:ATP-binding protein [Geobacteraceae bacterium]
MDHQFNPTEMDELRERVNELSAANEKLRAEIARRDNSALAVLQSEQLLLALVNKVPVGIFATDITGNIFFVNEVWSEIVGIPPARAVGHGWIDAVHPDDREEVCRAWAAAAGQKREFSYECCFRNASGKKTWVFCRAQANLNDAGAIEGYFGTIIDITERKRYEEEVHRLNAELEERVHQRTRQLSLLSEENDKKLKELSLLYRLGNTILSTIKLNKLIHLILVALTSGENPLFDRAMLFLLNERAGIMQGMLGVTRETSRGLISTAAKAGDMLAGRWDLPEEDMVRQREAEFSCRVRGSRLELNGLENVSSRAVLEKRLIFVPDVAQEKVDREIIREFGIRSFATVPLIAKEQVIGVVLVDNGLSERPISEDDLRFLQLFTNQAGMAVENSMLYNRIEDTNRTLREAQERLIQGERLTTIGEMAAGIAHELKNPLVSIGGFARRLKNKLPPGSTERDYAETIVQEVLRLEKMLMEILSYSKKTTLCYSQCNVNEIVEDALAITAPTMEDSRITVIRRYRDSTYSLTGDCQQLKQVFLNLFWNAQESMKNGGQLEITVSPTRYNGRKAVSVKVSDTGGGIKTEVLHNIFKPFYTTKETGTGLGLPISSRIVTNHGGKIRVNNHLGVGAEFNVILPVND